MAKTLSNPRFQFRVKKETLKRFKKLVSKSHLTNEGFLIKLMDLHEKNKSYAEKVGYYND